MLARTALASLVVASSLAAAAVAEDLIAYEGFEYPASSNLQGKNGGTGWSGAWANVGAFPTGVNATGLTWPNLLTAGGCAKTNASLTFEYSMVQRGIASFSAPDDVIYVSFLFRPDAGYGTGGGLRFGNWPYTMLVGAFPGGYVYGIMTTNGLGDDSNVPVVQGETALLVARIAKNAVGNMTYSLYVNPIVGAPQPPFPSAEYATPGSVPQGINLMNDGGFTTDEIRVGTTWASVLPTLPVCVGDFNDSGAVDGADLGFLLAFWGLPGGDLDGDGTTSGADLGLLLANWGGC